MIYIILAIIISFLYKILEWCTKKILSSVTKYTIYIWALVILILSFLIRKNYIWNLPRMNDTNILGMFFFALIVSFFLSKNSGYRPIGRFNCFNFVLVYPIFEELSFRGLILPLIFSCNIIDSWSAIIISAFLFAISHLQYYKLNLQSIKFMFYAFLGGLFFAYIAIATESILLTIPLHIAFNLSATYHSNNLHHDKTK